MPVKYTTKTRLLYKRLFCLNISDFSISHSCYSTGTFAEVHFILSKTHRANKSLVSFNSQITKHGRNGDVREAESVFCSMPSRNTVSWTAMLTAYAENGEIVNARNMFDIMPQRNTASYNAMITAYVKNNCMIDEAFDLFLRIPKPNAVSYAAMITGFVRAGMFGKAENLYFVTPTEWRDPVCSNAMIGGYLKIGRFEEAFRVFDGMLVRDVVSWSSMVNGYCKAGRIVDARYLFDKMPDRNVVTWTAMIDGYMKDMNFKEGFELFIKMRREGKVDVNPTTLSVMFDACGSISRYKEGIQMHGLVTRMGLDFEVILDNSILVMYCRFGCLIEGTKMFYTMRKRDAISWNSLIAGYVQCADINGALEVFERMPKKDKVSWTTMISGFFSKGLLKKAIKLFRMMPEKDTVSWTAVISGFVSNEEYEEAFRWFTEMLRQAVRINPLTEMLRQAVRINPLSLSSIISASSCLATLNQGLQIHGLVIKMNMQFDLSIQNSLVSMYSKCGDLPAAWKSFVNIESPNIVSFNSMISGFAQNGLGKEALNLFHKMVKEGCEPNGITFLGVFSACVHVGLVEEGWKYFRMMESSYNIEAGPDHYACMVDLLGRAGLVDEAVELINSMSFEPHPGVWGALLGTSKTHLRLDVAEIAAQKLIELEPDNATTYVVMSNLHSILGKKKDGDQLRMTKKLKGIKKSPGCSWIVIKDKVNSFLAGDKSHIDIEEIRIILWIIMAEMRQLNFDSDKDKSQISLDIS
ncbi:hypothetical protein L484_004129 [Morus notabilis]|uniref:Pentatricopeptide repeat-containing protein n=2 Tax=Morus notabilis TaxID=981085 RepID=W9SNT3_9ROSA|nr:hypothetical protein L484_004129 [Morus notabilis]